jgi:sulfate-transporting ATPase
MRTFLSALVIGLFSGTVYAMMALGLVAPYRISRVVNFALPGIAAFGAYIYWWSAVIWGAPKLVAVIAALLAGTVVGAALGVANRWMKEWPRGFVMIVTLTVTLLLFGWVDHVKPASPVSPPPPFGGGGFQLGLAYVTWHQVATLVTCVAVTLVLAYVVKRSRVGIYIRAIYDDPAGAATPGVPAERFVVGVWASAGLLAALAGIMVSPRTELDTLAFLYVTIWALAGSVLGGLESFPVAFAGSVVLGTAQGVLGGVFSGHLGPGMEDLSAIVIMAAAVFYAGTKRRDLAYLQT